MWESSARWQCYFNLFSLAVFIVTSSLSFNFQVSSWDENIVHAQTSKFKLYAWEEFPLRVKYDIQAGSISGIYSLTRSEISKVTYIIWILLTFILYRWSGEAFVLSGQMLMKWLQRHSSELDIKCKQTTKNYLWFRTIAPTILTRDRNLIFHSRMILFIDKSFVCSTARKFQRREDIKYCKPLIWLDGF